MTQGAHRFIRLTCVCLAWSWLVSALPGCGGGGSGRVTAPPTPTPTPGPVRTVVIQGTFTLPAPDPQGNTFFVVIPFTTAATGSLEATVDWTFATNTLFIYITAGNCMPQQFANADCPGGPSCMCQFVVSSEVQVPKPRVLTLPNASAGTRTLIVWSLGPREESVSYQVVLIS